MVTGLTSYYYPIGNIGVPVTYHVKVTPDSGTGYASATIELFDTTLPYSSLSSPATIYMGDFLGSGQNVNGAGPVYFNYNSDVIEVQLATSGSDTIEADNASPSTFTLIFGMAGDDTITGYVGYDHLWAGEDDDLLIGGGGDDFLEGWSGDDIIWGGDQNNMWDSGYANDRDWLWGNIIATGVSITSEINLLYGSGGNDGINGAGGPDEIWGGAGNDLVHGYPGDDIIHGGDGTFASGTGDDYLTGGLGVDQILGEDGNDIIRGDDLTASSGSGDFLEGGEGMDNIWGGEGDDYIRGDDGDDFVRGEADDDTIYGDSGNDALDGGAGTDVLFGDDGSGGGSGGKDFLFDFDATGGDTLSGEGGDDLLWSVDSSATSDSIDGGSGSDEYWVDTSPTTEVPTTCETAGTGSGPGSSFTAPVDFFVGFANDQLNWPHDSFDFWHPTTGHAGARSA